MKDIRVELLSEKRLFDIATNGRNIMEHFWLSVLNEIIAVTYEVVGLSMQPV